MTPGATVSVVIPTWNRADLLANVLRTVAEQTHPVNEVVVVDNGSTDGSADLAERLGASVIRLPRNQGFAVAVNRGIQACHGDFLAILNNDVTLSPDWLSILLVALSRESVWFALGKMVTKRDRGIIDGTFDAVCRGGTAWHCGSGRPDGPAWNRPAAVHFPPMAALLARRALFDRAGLLDEQFESYLEDVEFGLRLARTGHAGAYVPEAVAVHEGSATLGKWHTATVRRMARNQILLIRKHFAGGPLWPVLVAQLLWGCLSLKNGAGIAWLRGKIEGLTAKVEPSGDWPAIREAVLASEAGIRDMQRETGFDLYWKLYFALAGK